MARGGGGGWETFLSEFVVSADSQLSAGSSVLRPDTCVWIPLVPAVWRLEHLSFSETLGRHGWRRNPEGRLGPSREGRALRLCRWGVVALEALFLGSRGSRFESQSRERLSSFSP